MKTFLRIEALVILAGAVVANALGHGNWWLFAAFAVLPDAVLLLYLKRGGATWWKGLAYNVLHIYALPVALILVLWMHRPLFLLGWIAHIALDRVLGTGSRPMKRAAAKTSAEA